MSVPLSTSLRRRIAWIMGPDPRAADGLIASWVHPERRGYAYAEATGFAVRVLADLAQRTGDDTFRERARELAQALARVMAPCGGFGRGEWLYAFDTAICASALEVAGLKDEARLAGSFVTRCLADRCATAPRDASRPVEIGVRWSTRFGPHLIKAAAGIEAEQGRPRAVELARELTETHFEDARFHTTPAHEAVYVHAHCYGLEGLWLLEGASDTVRAGTTWLGEVQQADGSLPRWWSGDEGASGRAGDATAQAVRLWALVDRERFDDRIAVGLGYLATLETATGGIRYSADHAESNSWTTLFAIQAELIATFGPTPNCIA